MILGEILKKELLRKKNVIGVGWGFKYVGGKRTDEEAIIVFVKDKVPESELSEKDLIPRTIGGVKTDVREKTFRAFTTPEEKQKRWRPAQGGVSIGHYKITAGTFGTLVRRGNIPLILSNNHVLANMNNAKKNDPIYQPSPYDGGTKDDIIGYLVDWVPIEFEEGSSCPVATIVAGTYNLLARTFGAKTRLILTKEAYNEVDAAVARPAELEWVKDEIIDIGTPEGVVEPQLGMKVQKSGRTTCHTTGEIDTVELTVRVQYGYNNALFIDQIGIQPDEGKFSDGGDSGSAILDMDGRLVGLLFAGDQTGYTIANQISKVMEALEVDVL